MPLASGSVFSSSSPVLDHLLRTLAAVSPERRVLVLGPDGGRYVEALMRLGFEVHACTRTDAMARQVLAAVEESDGPGRAYATVASPGAVPYPEAHFGWVVARCLVEHNGKPAAPQEQHSEGISVEALLPARLTEARRLVRPGGWVYTVAPAALTSDALGRSAKQAGLAEAEAPSRAEETAVLRAIYRRVGESTSP